MWDLNTLCEYILVNRWFSEYILVNRWYLIFGGYSRFKGPIFLPEF